MPFRPCLVLLLALGLWACQPAAGPAPEQPPQRQDILNINERPEERSIYTVEWGAVRIPLAKYANPEVYHGTVEVEIGQFREIVGQELRLLKRGEEQEFELVGLQREPYTRSSPFWNAYPAFEQGRLDSSVAATFRQGIRQGDVVALRLVSKTDNTIVQSAIIKIADPFEAYQPAVQVPQPRYDGDLFGFQVIQESGRRPLLRIDTTSAATRHIYNLYRRNRLYKVIHIPGFQTYRRLLTGRDQLFHAKAIRHSELLGEGHDWLNLPEYTAFEGAEANLEWGALTASPSSENTDVGAFKENIAQPLVLRVGERALPLLGFQLFIDSKERLPELYVADSLNTPALLRALYQVQPASTVYFDKLIVEGEQGKLMLFPAAFAFNIGAERHSKR